jgi:hypothetical protein
MFAGAPAGAEGGGGGRFEVVVGPELSEFDCRALVDTFLIIPYT